MATEPKGPQRVQVKVLDADTGKEISTHEMSVAQGGGFCSSCTTTLPHHPGAGPPKM